MDMLIMGIDTSTTVASVALARDNNIIGEYSIDSSNTHSEKLMPMIENMVYMLGIEMDEIDVFAVSLGPGSFTGLRIGVATAKSFAYALNKKIVGESSLKVIANNVKYFDGLIVPIMDARNRRVFGGIYASNDNNIISLKEDSPIELDSLFEDIDELKKEKNIESDKIIFLGKGIEVYKEDIVNKYGMNVKIASMSLYKNKASSLCELGTIKYNNGEFEDYYTISPEYLRDSQAEQQKKKKLL